MTTCPPEFTLQLTDQAAHAVSPSPTTATIARNTTTADDGRSHAHRIHRGSPALIPGGYTTTFRHQPKQAGGTCTRPPPASTRPHPDPALKLINPQVGRFLSSHAFTPTPTLTSTPGSIRNLDGTRFTEVHSRCRTGVDAVLRPAWLQQLRDADMSTEFRCVLVAVSVATMGTRPLETRVRRTHTRSVRRCGW